MLIKRELYEFKWEVFKRLESTTGLVTESDVEIATINSWEKKNLLKSDQKYKTSADTVEKQRNSKASGFGKKERKELL